MSYGSVHIIDPAPKVTVRVDEYGALHLKFTDGSGHIDATISPDREMAGEFSDRLRGVADEIDAWAIAS